MCRSRSDLISQQDLEWPALLSYTLNMVPALQLAASEHGNLTQQKLGKDAGIGHSILIDDATQHASRTGRTFCACVLAADRSASPSLPLKRSISLWKNLTCSKRSTSEMLCPDHFWQV